MRFDTLIRGGTVVDGSGNPPYRAAVAIDDDRMTVVRGDASAIEADDVVDATGMVVAPGFIDAHSHSDLTLTTDPQLEWKIRQGVTTEVVGVDGLSYAPYPDPDDGAAFVLQNAGIGGTGRESTGWRGVGDQLADYDGRTAVNVAAFVGNSALRVAAMGWDAGSPDPRQRDRMAGLLREAMDEGARGLSTGLDYPPGAHADTSEVTALARVAGAAGGVYHTHVRYALGDRFLDPFREAVEICADAEVPLHITHFSKSARDEKAGGAQTLLDLVDDSIDRVPGLSFDTYPYEWGGTRLTRLLPEWVQAGHPAQLRRRLQDADLRARVAADVEASPAARAYRMSRPFADLRLSNLTFEDDIGFEGRYLTEVIGSTGTGLGDTLIGLVQRNPAATFTRPSPHAMTLWKFVVHPRGMVASDGVYLGSAASPRAYGCFARYLGDFVRDERLLSLPEAVRKITSFPAQVLGLRDRGVIRSGAFADVVVFDPAIIAARATYEAPREMAVGVRDVFVNGRAALRGDAMQGVFAGRGLRER